MGVPGASILSENCHGALDMGIDQWTISRCSGTHLQGSSVFRHGFTVTCYQWEFQDPKMEVPTIYTAYVRAMAPKYGLIWYSTSILESWNSH